LRLAEIPVLSDSATGRYGYLKRFLHGRFGERSTFNLNFWNVDNAVLLNFPVAKEQDVYRCQHGH
jgi:hypothetical protein